MDAQFAAEHQLRLAEAMAENAGATRSLQEDMNKSLRITSEVQRMVGYIEVFFASVYLAELWDMFASHVKLLDDWVAPGVIISAGLGALGGLWILKPWRHKSAQPRV
jgi:hypothetical protein